MPTFPALTRFVGRACGSLDRLRNGRVARALIERATSESGFSLIEVIASSLIVGLIVVGTLTGFVSAGRASADSRQHNQALLLAAQDEEGLRAMNVTELGRMGALTRPTVTENGTVYTIESSAQFIAAAKEEFTCETSGGTADYIQTTSKVTWLSLGKTENKKRVTESLSQSSLIPVPTSASLLVNVVNQANEPVSGATVKVIGKTMGTVEQTTPESGCVIFGALPDSEVEITATKPGWVNEQGETEPAATEATLSTTSLVSDTFVISSPGGVKVEFESAGPAVQGDTIYATHTGLSKGVVGGTVGSYVTSVLGEGLFPYATAGTPPGESPYTVYAGDCSADDPQTLSKKEVTDRAVQVNPGVASTVKVEVPPVNLTLYEGSSSTLKGALDSGAEVKLTNMTCGSAARSMKTVSGALEHKYLPYAKFKLCLAQTVNSKHFKYTTEVSNYTKSGVSVPTIYMSAPANEEKINPLC
jgi:type II secretory pathway pseudopilin PulG